MLPLTAPPPLEPLEAGWTLWLLPSSRTVQWTEIVTLCSCLLSSFRILYLVQMSRYSIRQLRFAGQNGATMEVAQERLRKAKERFAVVLTIAIYSLVRMLVTPSETLTTFILLQYFLPALFTLLSLYIFIHTEQELRGRDRIVRYLRQIEQRRMEAEEKSLAAIEIADKLRRAKAEQFDPAPVPPAPPEPPLPT